MFFLFFLEVSFFRFYISFYIYILHSFNHVSLYLDRLSAFRHDLLTLYLFCFYLKQNCLDFSMKGKTRTKLTRYLILLLCLIIIRMFNEIRLLHSVSRLRLEAEILSKLLIKSFTKLILKYLLYTADFAT